MTRTKSKSKARARQRITAEQRRRVFAIASAVGLDLDGVRALTPKGSVSRLTRRQADELIGRLKALELEQMKARAGQGTATPYQLATIHGLQERVGFDDAAFTTWLRRFQVDGFGEINTRELASGIIFALQRMVSTGWWATGTAELEGQPDGDGEQGEAVPPDAETVDTTPAGGTELAPPAG